MENQILFKEKQRFTQWWAWLILLSVNGLCLFGIFKQLILGEQFGTKPMNNISLFIATAIVLLISLLFLKFRLETVIKADGIYVKFYPFHLSYKHYKWDRVVKLYIRKYNPLLEFGGWGLRFNFKGNKTAYNVSGNKGLQLVFKNNEQLLIGTKKPEEIKEVLNKLGQLKP